MPKTITPTELQGLLANNPDLRILDVRTPLEHGEVHIAGSKLHPLDRLDPHQATGGLEEGAPIYVVCRSGNRACKAIEQLEAAGFPHAVLVTGGVQAWEEQRLPVVRGQKVVSLERQVRIAAGALVLLGAVLGFATGSPWWHGLSAFVGAGLMFAGITNTCAMGLLIARMPWNRRQPASCTVSPDAPRTKHA